MKSVYDIIREPVITEASIKNMQDRKYTFKVPASANKVEIKNAVETIFGVEVEKVTTITMKRKTKRVGYHVGKTAEWKKAIVKLTADSKSIEFFDSLM